MFVATKLNIVNDISIQIPSVQVTKSQIFLTVIWDDFPAASEASKQDI